MRFLATNVLLATVAMAAAIPITPAALEHQYRAEQLRSEGIPEIQIAEQLALPFEEQEVEPSHFITQLSTKFHSIFRSDTEIAKRDLSGDIAPGSLEGPQMLPRAAAPESFVDTIKSMLKGEDSKRREFGYEGKELEMRRPEGMRHWIS